MSDTASLIATVALVCLCAAIGVRAGRDMGLNWRAKQADNWKATHHLKARTASVAGAVTAPLLTAVSWPVALFILALAVGGLFVIPNRVLEERR